MAGRWLRFIGWLRGPLWRDRWLRAALLRSGEDEFLSLWLCRSLKSNYEIVCWSAGAEDLYGHNEAAAIGRSYVDLIVSQPEQAEALLTTEETIVTGKVWRNYLNRDERNDGELVLTLTQNIRVWSPFHREYLFGEIGLDVSDLFESEHALLERRDEDRMSVNEMTRLIYFSKAVSVVPASEHIGDLGFVVARELATALGEGSRAWLWLVRDGEPVKPVADFTERVTERGPVVEVAEVSDLSASGEVVVLSRPNAAWVRAAIKIRISDDGCVAIAIVAPRQSDADRSRLFVDSLLQTGAGALNQWALGGSHRRADSANPGPGLGLVEADLVASELAHIAKNRLSTLQGVCFNLRQALAPLERSESLEHHVGRLEKEISDTATALQLARDGLSVRPHLAKDLIEQAIQMIDPLSERCRLETSLVDEMVAIVPFNLLTALSNLVRNGIESAEAAREQYVVEVIAESEMGLLIIDVHDRGKGIDPEQLAVVFEEGYTTKGVNHLGKGLGNARRAVLAGSGEIEIVGQSEDLGGAHFRLKFPLDLRSAPIRKDSHE